MSFCRSAISPALGTQWSWQKSQNDKILCVPIFLINMKKNMSWTVLNIDVCSWWLVFRSSFVCLLLSLPECHKHTKWIRGKNPFAPEYFHQREQPEHFHIFWKHYGGWLPLEVSKSCFRHSAVNNGSYKCGINSHWKNVHHLHVKASWNLFGNQGFKQP